MSAAEQVEEAAAEARAADETVRVLVRFGWELPEWAIAGDVAKQYAFGLHYDYPVCCVEAFCRDLVDGHSPGERRGGVPVDHVPCEACHAELVEDGP